MSQDNDPEKKNSRLWKVDPSIRDPLPRAGLVQRRIIPPLKTLGQFSLISLGIAYPIILIILGLYFGGLVFWTSLAGSILIIWALLSKLGYARNFTNWTVPWKRFAGGLIGFPLAAGLYLSLIYLKLLAFPLIIAALGISVVLLFRNASSKT